MVSDVDYTVRESGLQLDQPPAIGNVSSVAVVILKNDNIEGILEFDQDFVNITGESKTHTGTEIAVELCTISNLQARHYND